MPRCVTFLARVSTVQHLLPLLQHNSIAVSKLMPHMVRDSSQIGGHALKKELLFDVHQNYAHLDNLLRCVASNSYSDTHQMNVARALFPDDDDGLTPALDKVSLLLC